MALDIETVNELVATVARFVRERLRPLEDQVAEEDAIPAHLRQEIAELGLFGLSIPEEYGGLGLNMEEEVRVALELGKTSPVFRSLIGTNNGIGSQGLILDGTEEQKRRYLPRLATGELISSFALTEPEAGTWQFSKMTSEVWEPFCPIFRSMGPRDRPGVPASTRNADTPLAPRSKASVRANTVKIPACGALVMKRFVPLRT